MICGISEGTFVPADAFDFGHELRWIGKGFVARMQEAGSHPCSHPSQSKDLEARL